MSKLKRELQRFDRTLQKEYVEIPGEMGAYIKGKKTVEVPNRPNYVYVRLRTNLSEIIQAQNDKVSPAYGLAVIVRRDGNKYIVDRRDEGRYENWEDLNKYVPRHGDTHSFDLDGSNIGADPVWVYPYQFMPSLVSPFGVKGAENAFIYPYSFVHNGAWHYSGNTGTSSLLDYRPPSGSSVVLITLDTESGNPYLFASTGTYIPSSITGTAGFIPYLPSFTESQYLPLSFVTMGSGTFGIGWNNIHDVRQLAGGGGITSVNSIPHNGLGGLQGGVSGSYYHLSAVDYNDLLDGGNTALHSHSGTAADVIFEMDGYLAAITGSAVPYLITRPTTIESWYIYSEKRGVPSGTIIADINLHRNGITTSIFINQADRPMLTYEDSNGWAYAIPGVANFQEGDILSPDIDQISTGASGLVLVGKISGVGASSNGLLVSDGVGQSISVGTVVFDGTTVTDDGGRQATVKGVIVSVTTVQTRTQDTYSATTSGDGTAITPLDIVFTPKKAGNRVVLEWTVNFECDHNSVFNVSRNGTILANSNDGVNQWSGIATVPYDNDIDTTPNNITVKIVDENSLDISSTYSLLIRSSNGVTHTLYLNRTVAGAGGDGGFKENMLSMGMAMELNT